MSKAIRPGIPGTDEVPRSSEVRQTLERAFAASAPPGVVAAYLFGSHAEGRSHRESDVDVAVLLDDRIYPTVAERSEARVRIASWLVGALSVNDVDLLVLNGAPPLLGRKVVTDGLSVHVADAERAREFVRDVQLRAADLAPFLARHRITLLEALAR
ncbi:MAG: type VII toxin-antitoxin system MntA family adenylyltransferase antitoxin [Thermoanaerobaculia bacterium]